MKKPQVDMRTASVFLSAVFVTLSVGVANGADRRPPVPILKPLPAAEAVREESGSPFAASALPGNLPGLTGPQPYGLADAETGNARGNVADRAVAMLDAVLAKLGLSWEEVRSATAVEPLPALAQSPYDQGFEADGEIRLAIGPSQRVSIGPAYGLQLQDDEPHRAGKDVDHHFKLGARLNF